MTSQGDSNDSNSSRSLYLTEADRHRVIKGSKPLETHELRRQIFLWLLFWDNLVVSDSTINNNEKLRPLLKPEIEKPKDLPVNVLLDYDYLLKEGYIRAAMRQDVSGFRELLEEHQRPIPAPNLPTRDYAEAMDELIPEKFRLRWQRDSVELYFKKNLIKVFSSETPFRDHGIPVKASKALRSFIESKGEEPINYRELRHFLDYPDDYCHRINLPEAAEQIREKRFRNAIERRISEAYRFNVPAALGLHSEATRDSLPWWVAFGDTSVSISTQTGKSHQPDMKNIRPCWVFDEEILGQIPASAIGEVKKLPSYHEFVAKLHRSYTFGRQEFLSEFADLWEDYAKNIEQLFRGQLQRSLEQKVIERQRTIRQKILLGLVGIGLEIAVSFYFPDLEYPFMFFDIYTIWKEYQDYKKDRDQIPYLSKLTGKPVLREYL
jgi:hypothetical protein